MAHLLQLSPTTASKSREIKLPNEILGQIYLENELPHYPAQKGSRYPPMAVSKLWRMAALSCPQLWVHIYIGAYSDLAQASPDSLKIWLSRSKPCLLQVVMYLCNRELEEAGWSPKLKDNHLFEPISRVLFSQACRWGVLDVVADVWQYSHIFRVLDRAHQLRALTLEDYIHDEKEMELKTVYEPWDAAEVPRILLPSVTSLSILLHRLPISAFPPLDLPNLTSLFLQNFIIGLEDLATMMKRMPRLASLIFDCNAGVECDTNRLPEDAIEACGRLANLTVQNSMPEYSLLPLLAEHCPNLRLVTLHFICSRDFPPSQISSLTDLTLVLEQARSNERFSYAEAHDAFIFCPNVRRLTLSWQPFGRLIEISLDPFIRALASGRDVQESVLLKLEHLTLQKAVVSMSFLLEMVRARSHSVFKSSRNDGPFHLTLEGCFGLPDIRGGSITEVTQLFADPPGINRLFCNLNDPYGL